jgi:S-adenosylmethionine hydrolase
LSFAKGGLLNVIGKEINSIKQVTELQAVVAEDKNAIKGYVIYIDHFGNVLSQILQKTVFRNAKGRPYEIPMIQKRGIKESKTIFWAKYSDMPFQQAYGIKYYEGDKLAIFNEAGFLEIAIFRSNPNSG